MHLLGSSVLVFLLLPLVLSCNSTKTKEEISNDYNFIIQKQLENISFNIPKHDSCGERKLVLNNFPPLERINIVSCYRLPRNISDQLGSKLQKLTSNINLSLGCECSPHQAKHAVKWPESQSLQKRFCRLKRLLMTIQKAYEQYNSAS